MHAAIASRGVLGTSHRRRRFVECAGFQEGPADDIALVVIRRPSL